MTSPVTEGQASTPWHPVLNEWFKRRYGEPTTTQQEAWEAIRNGENVLISSPTGSGKTLAALMPCINRLVAHEGLTDDTRARVGVRVLYVTPLKALNNDVLEHLEEYEREMSDLAASMGVEWPGFRAAVRTGDTTASKRGAMLKKPPDILITTPESLYILLTSVRGQEILREVDSLIVDEVHHLADSSRGAHFSLSVERLLRLTGRPFLRIGLSATQKPISRVATFLGGWLSSGHPRHVTIVESSQEISMDLTVLAPVPDLGVARREDGVWNPLVELVCNEINGHRTTIIFVNNRRLCERLVYRMNEHMGFEVSRAHHGSISREERLESERLFKNGELRCIVATSSLELGLDVGHVELVIQVDSPKRVNALLQRIGRAEHTLYGVSKGEFILKNLSEVFELCALIHLVEVGEKDEIHVVRDRMDILCQQAVSMAAVSDYSPEDLLEAASHSDCYHRLELADVMACLDVVTGAYPFTRKLVRLDPEANLVSRLPGTAMAALMGSGTIVSTGMYPVVHAESKIKVGDLDEEFVHESRVGDVFRLGANSWRIRSISHQSVTVAPSGRSAGSVPFWRGEEYGRSYDVGIALGQVLSRIEETFEPFPSSPVDSTPDVGTSILHPVILGLMNRYHLDNHAATYAARTIALQRRVASVPTDRRIVVETFRDETRATHVLIHSVFGLRFNRTWLLAFLACLNGDGRMAGAFDSSASLYTRAKDDGIHFVFSSPSFPVLDLVWQVTKDNLVSLLTAALPSTSQFALAFRRQAETALLLTRGWTRTPTWKRRMQSDELLREAATLDEPFPLYRSAQKECLEADFDVVHVLRLLEDMAMGRVEVVIRETTVSSPMARPFLSDWSETKLYQREGVSPEVARLLSAFDDSYVSEWFSDENDSTFVPDGVANKAIDVEPRHAADNDEGQTETLLLHPNVWLSHLVELHHLRPNARLEGIEGLRQVIAQLQGIFLPASHWESTVFPSRIAGYRKEDLDLLCATGEVRWLGRRDDGQKEGRIAFFTSDSSLNQNALYDMNLPVTEPNNHEETLRLLRERGASFMASLFVDGRTTGQQMLTTLFELVWEGRVSNDQFAPIRHHVDPSSRRHSPLKSAVGRWYATSNSTGDGVASAKRGVGLERDKLAQLVKQRLLQYGLICRAMFNEAAVSYDIARGVLLKLEDVGIVTRGLFVSGIPSVQFANRRFVARLLSQSSEVTTTTLVSAVDPANPFGLFLPWPNGSVTTFARKPGNYLVIHNGRWLMWVESAGRRMSTIGEAADDLNETVLKQVFQILVRTYGMRKIRLDLFNGVPIQESPVAPWMERLGAEKNGKSYVLWSLNLRR